MHERASLDQIDDLSEQQRGSRNIRVLHCSPTWFSSDSVLGGGERWVDNVIRAVAAGAPWVQQAMVALGQKDGLDLRGPAALRILSAESGPGGTTEALSAYLWDEFRSFDVVHVHQALTDFGAYACCVAASLGKTIVATDLGGAASPVMNHVGLSLAHGVVSISDYAHSLVSANLRSPSIALIGPIDTAFWHPAATPPEAPAVICVSRVMPHKGIDRILRALPVGLKLRIVGRVYHDAYRDLLGELAAGKDVEFIHDATDEDVRALYQRSTLFAQGSCFRDVYGNLAPKTELMGLTTLEAMSCGLPVVVSADGGSLPELVTDPAFGRVFHDHADLADVLRQHRAGAWPAPGSAQAARAHVIEASGEERYGVRLAAFYEEIHARRVEAAGCAS